MAITVSRPTHFCCWMCSAQVPAALTVCPECRYDHNNSNASRIERKAQLASTYLCPSCGRWGYNHPEQAECEHCGWHPTP